jgi:hypothetical protein
VIDVDLGASAGLAAEQREASSASSPPWRWERSASS